MLSMLTIILSSNSDKDDPLVIAVLQAILDVVSSAGSADEGDIIVAVVTKIRQYFEINPQNSNTRYGGIILEVVKTLHSNYAIEEFSYSIGNVMISAVSAVNDELKQTNDISKINVAKLMQTVVTKINTVYKASSSSRSVDVTTLIVTILEAVQNEICFDNI